MKAENAYASFEIKEGVLFFIYKEGIDIDLATARKIVSFRLNYQKGKKYPVLCNVNGIRSIDVNARRFLATEGSVLIKAVALVSDTPLSLILSEIFIKGNSPTVPARVCINEKEGMVIYLNFL